MAWLHDERCRIMAHAFGSPTSSLGCMNGYCVTKAGPFHINSATSKRLSSITPRTSQK